MNFYRLYEALSNFILPDGVAWDTPPAAGASTVARIKIGNEAYSISFEAYEEAEAVPGQTLPAVILSFGTQRTGIYRTDAGIPVEALTKVFGILNHYLSIAHPDVLFYDGASWKLRQIYERLFARLLGSSFVSITDGLLVRRSIAERAGIQFRELGTQIAAYKKIVGDENKKRREFGR